MLLSDEKKNKMLIVFFIRLVFSFLRNGIFVSINRADMKIYTKSGDKGTTRIHGGGRVDKDDIRIEANGTLDELNAAIGVVRSFLGEGHEWQSFLYEIQKNLMLVMSQVATPSEIRGENTNILPPELVTFCEAGIDRLSEEIQEEGYFILPGGNLVSAHCHLARTIARRAERHLWTLNRKDGLPAEILIFLNRLSDLFFVMARVAMQREGGIEEKWKSFTYKKNK